MDLEGMGPGISAEFIATGADDHLGSFKLTVGVSEDALEQSLHYQLVILSALFTCFVLKGWSENRTTSRPFLICKDLQANWPVQSDLRAVRRICDSLQSH